MHSSRHTQRTIRSLGGLAAATPAGDQSAIAAVTRRGYTGHSMLGSMGLIHMNGRVHDAILGRFLSPDPTVPHPGFTQSYNRYAYVNNNPLSFTDPSGFSEASKSRRPMDVLAEIVVWGAVEGCGSLAGHEEAMCLALINWFDTLGAGDLMCMMAGGLACQPLAGFQQADSEQSAGVGGYSTGPRNRGSRAAGAKAVSAATVSGAKPQGNGFGLKDAASLGLGVTPAGTVLDFCTAARGKDCITGDKVSGFWRWAGIVPWVSELRKGGRVVDAIRHTPDQQAVKELADELTMGGRTPMSRTDAETILDWATEYNYPGAAARPGDVASPSNWTANPVPHIHLPGAGRSGHVPVAPGVQPRP